MVLITIIMCAGKQEPIMDRERTPILQLGWAPSGGRGQDDTASLVASVGGGGSLHAQAWKTWFLQSCITPLASLALGRGVRRAWGGGGILVMVMVLVLTVVLP